MIYFRRILYLLFISLFFCLLATPAFPAFLDKVGTRPLGMGGAFVAVADEPSAVMWNSAGLAQMKQTEIVATYAALYTGLGEDGLGRAYIGYTLPLRSGGALGINYIRLQSPLYRENTIAFSYSQRLRFLYLGLNAKGLFANFVENEYTKVDPLFQDNGLLTKAFGIDLGLLLNVKNAFSLGLFAQNINQPNMALEEGQESIVPLELNAGIAFKSLKVNPCFDLTFRNDKIRNKRDINVRFGMETWLFNDLGLRTGANLYELTAGASYCFKEQDVELQLDYAFSYPMPFQFAQSPITNTTGSHQFSLSLRFDHLLQLMGAKKPEKKVEPALQEALSYQEAGNYEAAIAAYRQVLQKDDANQEAHFLLAGIYTKLRRYEEAITHYSRAVELAPDEPRFHYALGSLYEQYGDDTRDKKWYNKAIIEFAKTMMLDTNYNNVSSKLEKIRQKEQFK
jgi:tetratricopeptide (TPR) repeat protein